MREEAFGLEIGKPAQNTIPHKGKTPKAALPQWMLYLFPKFKISPDLIKQHMTKKGDTDDK